MFRRLAALHCPACGVLMRPDMVLLHADKRPAWLFRPGRVFACLSCDWLCWAEAPSTWTGIKLVLLPFILIAWLLIGAWLMMQPWVQSVVPSGELVQASVLAILMLPVFPAMVAIPAWVARGSVRLLPVQGPRPF